MFEKKRISLSLPERFKKLKSFFCPQENNKKYIHLAIISFFIVSTLLIIGFSINLAAKKSRFSSFIPHFFTKEIKTDKFNHTNFLLVGVGGELHEGGELTDTIIVASLDHNNNHTSLLSIPRDYFIKNTEFNSRINTIYSYAAEKNGSSSAGLRTLSQEVAAILNIPIHYYLKINFDGFIKAVDILGGININLKNPFFDPAYPKGETLFYETFFLPAGNNHLDGQTALKYVRSRHSTSDFSRSERQHQVLAFLKNNALSLGFLSSPSKIKKMFDAFQQNIETNLSLTEIFYLGKIAKNFPVEKMQSIVLHDNPASAGGLLYTPPQAEYGGAYVLRPWDATEISELADYFLMHPDIFKTQTPLQVLNTSGIVGLAAETKMMLARHGFNVIRFGNGKTSKNLNTIIYSKNPKNTSAIITILEKYFPGAKISEQIPPEYLQEPYLSSAEIIIEIGKDYSAYVKNHRARFQY